MSGCIRPSAPIPGMKIRVERPVGTVRSCLTRKSTFRAPLGLPYPGQISRSHAGARVGKIHLFLL